MASYNALCTWTAGIKDVDAQVYTWIVDGSEVATGELQPNEESRASVQDGVTINPQDIVTFNVLSKNQYGESDPATATGTAPAPMPEAPTGVTMVFSEVVTPARR